jgi:hypothetical protein
MRPGIVTGFEQVLERLEVAGEIPARHAGEDGLSELEEAVRIGLERRRQPGAAGDGLELVAAAARDRAARQLDRGAPRRLVLGHLHGHRQALAEELHGLIDLEPGLDRLVGSAPDLDDVRHPHGVVAGVHQVVEDLLDGPLDGQGVLDPGHVVLLSGGSHNVTWAGWTVCPTTPTSSAWSASRSTSSRSRPPNASSVRAAS